MFRSGASTLRTYPLRADRSGVLAQQQADGGNGELRIARDRQVLVIEAGVGRDGGLRFGDDRQHPGFALRGAIGC